MSERGTIPSMRFVVALAALLPAVAFACSDNPATPTDAGTDASNVQPDAPTTDATVEAGADAPSDVSIDACAAPDDAETSTRCSVVGPCSTCAAGTLYRCDGARQRPLRAMGAGSFVPLAESRAIASDGGTTDYCAPSACVRSAADDATCGPDFSRPLAIRCPAKPDGDSAATIPSFCSYLGPLVPGAKSIRMCCDTFPMPDGGSTP